MTYMREFSAAVYQRNVKVVGKVGRSELIIASLDEIESSESW